MPNNSKIIKKSTSDEMGAIDRFAIGSRNHVKNRSASVESNNLPNIICSSCTLFDDEVETKRLGDKFNDKTSSNFKTGSRESLIYKSNSQIARQATASDTKTTGKPTKSCFLSPFSNRDSGDQFSSSSALRPSVSTSCLFSGCNFDSITGQPNQSSGSETSSEISKPSQSSSSSLVCIPTRASLTHEWRKLKTPNKCRECNFLVYFNGRECSSCGFVAHKKCLMVLVIKCSGQHLLSYHEQQQRRRRFNEGESPTWTSAMSFFSRNQNILLGENNNSTNDATNKIKNKKFTLLDQTTKQQHYNAFVVSPMFGRPIVDVDGEQVLDFINRFIYEIDTRGLSSKGIYRVSSIKSKVDKLCNYYDQNHSSLIDLSSFHPNIIANTLKMYLRRLPEPLLTLELYPHFIELAKKYPASSSDSSAHSNFSSPPSSSSSLATSPLSSNCSNDSNKNTTKHRHHKPLVFANYQDRYDPNVMINEFKHITRLLPKLNHDIVSTILRHLRRVADMADENQMSCKNLSIIFGPTLLSPPHNKALAIADNIHQARVVELMIKWAYQIFSQ